MSAPASKGWKSLDLKEKIETISGKGRFTCIDSNKSIIALGTAAGSIYFYDYNTFKPIEIITNPEVKGAISHIKLSNSTNTSNTHFVAVSSKSTVFIFTASFDPSRDYRQKLVTKTTAHKTASSVAAVVTMAAGSGASASSGGAASAAASSKEPEITCLEWDNVGEKLYSGDDMGNIILSNSSSLLFKSQVITKLDSRIVQINADSFTSNVVISDMTKSIIYNPTTSECTQVGKQLRNGAYGACYHPQRKDTLFLARPNMRVWAASAAPPVRVLKTLKFEQQQQAEDSKMVKMLGRMQPYGRYVLSWSETGGIAILDTDKPALLQSIIDMQSISDVTDIYKDSSSMLVLTADCSVYRIHKKAPATTPAATSTKVKPSSSPTTERRADTKKAPEEKKPVEEPPKKEEIKEEPKKEEVKEEPKKEVKEEPKKPVVEEPKKEEVKEEPKKEEEIKEVKEEPPKEASKEAPKEAPKEIKKDDEEKVPKSIPSDEPLKKEEPVIESKPPEEPPKKKEEEHEQEEKKDAEPEKPPKAPEDAPKPAEPTEVAAPAEPEKPAPSSPPTESDASQDAAPAKAPEEAPKEEGTPGSEEMPIKPVALRTEDIEKARQEEKDEEGDALPPELPPKIPPKPPKAAEDAPKASEPEGKASPTPEEMPIKPQPRKPSPRKKEDSATDASKEDAIPPKIPPKLPPKAPQAQGPLQGSLPTAKSPSISSTVSLLTRSLTATGVKESVNKGEQNKKILAAFQSPQPVSKNLGEELVPIKSTKSKKKKGAKGRGRSAAKATPSVSTPSGLGGAAGSGSEGKLAESPSAEGSMSPLPAVQPAQTPGGSEPIAIAGNAGAGGSGPASAPAPGGEDVSTSAPLTLEFNETKVDQLFKIVSSKASAMKEKLSTSVPKAINTMIDEAAGKDAEAAASTLSLHDPRRGATAGEVKIDAEDADDAAGGGAGVMEIEEEAVAAAAAEEERPPPLPEKRGAAAAAAAMASSSSSLVGSMDEVPLTQAQETLDIEKLTDSCYHVYCTCENSNGLVSCETLLKPWLRLWLKRALALPDFPEAQIEKISNNDGDSDDDSDPDVAKKRLAEREKRSAKYREIIQKLALYCLDLEVTVPPSEDAVNPTAITPNSAEDDEEGSGSGAAKFGDANAAEIVRKFGAYLPVQKVCGKCVAKGYSEAVSELHKLYRDARRNPDLSTAAAEVERLLRGNDAVGALTRARQGGDLGLFLLVLPALSRADPTLTASKCIELYPRITPAQVERFCGGEESAKMLLSYLTTLFDTRAERFFAAGPEGFALLVRLFRLLLADGRPKDEELFEPGSGRGAPLVDSHRVRWPHERHLMRIVELCVNKMPGAVIEELVALCKEFGFWEGLSALYFDGTHAEQYAKDNIDLAISTDNFDLLKRLLGSAPGSGGNLDLWYSSLCTIFKRCSKDTASKTSTTKSKNTSENANTPTINSKNANSNGTVAAYDDVSNDDDDDEDDDVEEEFEMGGKKRAINPVSILRVMLSDVGPVAAIEVLSCVEHSDELLDQELIRLFLRVAHISLVEQPRIVNSILSSVDSYLWSKRPWVCGPQLRAVFEKECAGEKGTKALLAQPFLTSPSECASGTASPISKRGSAAAAAALSVSSPPAASSSSSSLMTSSGGAVLPSSPMAAGKGATAGKKSVEFDFAPLPVSYEEAGQSHWGVACNVNGTCPFCTLPLICDEEMGGGAGGGAGSGVGVGVGGRKNVVSETIVVFPKCGHCYHQSCLGVNGCVLCLQSNMSSLTRNRF